MSVYQPTRYTVECPVCGTGQTIEYREETCEFCGEPLAEPFDTAERKHYDRIDDMRNFKLFEGGV